MLDNYYIKQFESTRAVRKENFTDHSPAKVAQDSFWITSHRMAIGDLIGDLCSDVNPQKLQEWLKDERDFFTYLDSVPELQDCDEFKETKERFERNSKQSLKIAAMERNERLRLPLHETVYFDRFEKQVKKVSGLWRNPLRDRIELEDISITKEVLGRGGFAFVYKAHHEDVNYALKLFRPHDAVGILERERRSGLKTQILDNISENHEIYSQPPFITPIMATGSYEECQWYLMDYFDGFSVCDLAEKINLPHDNPELTHRVLSTYADVLHTLHSKGMVLVDNNWGSVLTKGLEVRICDYDFAMPQAKEAYGLPFNHLYGSRELRINQKYTFNSDLEAFALMIDHLYVGESFLKATCDHCQTIQWNSNERIYPKKRIAKLPVPLRDVITGLITYPRDDSITISDLQDAIGRL